LLRLLKLPDISQVVISVAFVNEAGVRLLEEQLREHAALVSVFAGIRNDITSYQGIVRLHDTGATVHLVDTGSRGILFHPKVYLVQAGDAAYVVIGSANLTPGGLNNNIEAGLLVELDTNAPADKALVEDIAAQVRALASDFPQHVVRVENSALLDELLGSGRLVDETVPPPPRPSTTVTGKTSRDTITQIPLKVPRLRSSPRGPRAPRPRARVTRPVRNQAGRQDTQGVIGGPAVGVAAELLWESKPLTRRDLTIPNNEGTHATGSMNLDKGLLSEDVDHRHYFRDVVFSQLAWERKSATVDKAEAYFHVVVKGISYGEHRLTIHHTNSTTSKAYIQRNAMTRLSWGPVKHHVARADLIGRTLSLYRDTADPTKFVLDID
jgi:HKD family nuclease